MSRFTQYRFLAAGSLAVAWMTIGIYASVARPALRTTIGLPALWVQGVGGLLGRSIGLQAGALAGLILVWVILAALLFAVLELGAYARRARR